MKIGASKYLIFTTSVNPKFFLRVIISSDHYMDQSDRQKLYQLPTIFKVLISKAVNCSSILFSVGDTVLIEFSIKSTS